MWIIIGLIIVCFKFQIFYNKVPSDRFVFLYSHLNAIFSQCVYAISVFTCTILGTAELLKKTFKIYLGFYLKPEVKKKQNLL